MRRFADLERLDDCIPDETTILNFRHLLERQDLTHALFQAVDDQLDDQGDHLSRGTMVDARLISAPGSTKDVTKSRDPDRHQTAKVRMGGLG